MREKARELSNLAGRNLGRHVSGLCFGGLLSSLKGKRGSRYGAVYKVSLGLERPSIFLENACVQCWKSGKPVPAAHYAGNEINNARRHGILASTKWGYVFSKRKPELCPNRLKNNYSHELH